MKRIFTTLPLVLMITGWIAAQSCSAPDGLNAQAQNDGMLLTWNAAANATGYRIKIEDAGNNPQDFVLEASTDGLQYLATTLLPNASYKFKVRTNCPGGRSNWSAYFFFTTGSGNNGGSGGGGTGVCEIPTGLTVSNITSNTATLSWSAVPGVLQYEVEVEDAENTAAFQFNIVTGETSITVLGLAPNGNYKFKVKSKCSGGSSLYSEWVFFSTGQSGTGGPGDDNGGNATCEVPTGLAVAEITDTKALLTWSKVAGAEKYEVEVEDDENTPLFTFQGVTTDTFIVITGLTPGGNYQFKVKSECGGGLSSNFTAWLFFTTHTGLVIPGAGAVNALQSASNNNQAAFAIYPNPARESVSIRTFPNTMTEAYAVRITDARGSLVYRNDNVTTEEIGINVNTLQNGFYFVTITGVFGTQSRQLVVAH